LLGQRLVAVGLVALAAIGATYLAASTTVLAITAVVLTAATVLIRIADGKLAYIKAQSNAVLDIQLSDVADLNALKHVKNNAKTALEVKKIYTQNQKGLFQIQAKDEQGNHIGLMDPLPSLAVFKALIDSDTFKQCFCIIDGFDTFWYLLEKPEYLEYFVQNNIVPATHFSPQRQFGCLIELRNLRLPVDKTLPLLVKYGFNVDATLSDDSHIATTTALSTFIDQRIANDKGLALADFTDRKRTDQLIEMLIRAGANTKVDEINLGYQTEAGELIKTVKAKIKANP
jgi:hypothetical protein